METKLKNTQLMLNKQLQEQVRRYLGDAENVPAELHDFLKAISRSYDEAEKGLKTAKDSDRLHEELARELNSRLGNETEKLKTSVHQLRTLFENIDEVFFSVGITYTTGAPKFQLLQMSSACLKVYGYTPEDFALNTNLWLDVVVKEDKHIINNNYPPLYEGKTISHQHRIIHKNKSIRWVETKIKPTMDEYGRLSRLDGITLDITNQKLTEISLHNSESNLRTIFENTNTSYILLDRDSNILSFNRLAAEMANKLIKSPLAEGKNYVSLMQDYRKASVQETINHVLSLREQVSYEVKYNPANEPETWLHVSMHPILGENKQILGISIASYNITLQKENERLLRESNERYELVTKATNDVIWDWDIPSDRIYRSENYNQIFGYPSRDQGGYISSYWLNRIHVEDRERVLSGLEKILRDPQAEFWECEYRYYTKGQAVSFVQDRGYLIRDEKGQPFRLVGAMRDISNEKNIGLKLEENIRELNTFIYRASHDLKGPLSSVIGLTNLAKKEIKDPEASRYLEMIGHSTGKLDHILVSLINTMAIKDARPVLEPVDLKTLFMEVINLFQFVDNFENIDFKVDIGLKKAFLTDKTILSTILRNIIENAIKYHNPAVGNPFIRIGTVDTGKGTQIRIRDNGMGMPEEIRLRAFDMFYRGNSMSKGSGLGLYLVKKAVERLNGQISIESKEGEGTEFILEFAHPVLESGLKPMFNE